MYLCQFSNALSAAETNKQTKIGSSIYKTDKGKTAQVEEGKGTRYYLLIPLKAAP